MDPLTRNGGMIGVTLDLATDSDYTTSGGFKTIQYVGGYTYISAGTTSTRSVTLTSLSGGLASSPAAGDIVIVARAIGLAGTDLAYNIDGYTQITNGFGNDTNDVDMAIGYKVMGSLPDTSVTITTGSYSSLNAIAVAVMVFRGVDPDNPIEALATNRSSINTSIVNFFPVTPSTTGAWIVAVGGSGHTAGSSTYTTSPGMTTFRTAAANDTYDVTVGMGYYDGWTSGSYTPSSWNMVTSTAYSSTGHVFALKPAPDVTILNKKNSGIWDLQAAYESIEIIPPFSPTWSTDLDTSIGTSGTTSPSIINNYYRRYIVAFTYTVAEIEAALGPGPLSIDGLRFSVSTQPTYQPLPLYAIGMKHTSNAPSVNPGSTGYTIVKNAGNEAFTTGATKTWYPFNTSFSWNGTDNIAFIFAWGQSPTNYSSTGTTPITAANLYYARSDASGNYTINVDNPSATATNLRPVIQIYGS